MRALVISLLSVFFCILSEARPLTFSPSPLNSKQAVLEEFSSMLSYLEEQSGKKIDFVYEEKYDDMIDAFEKNKIDLAYFGPLPLATLRKNFAGAIPIITFHEPNGQSGYRCVLVKFATDTLDFKDASNIKVALTQPLSTCGYMQIKVLLKTYANQNIENMKFNYLGNHENVALSIIRGAFLIGGMKESIAKEYQSLGLQILHTSQMLSSFTLVANANTLSEQDIANIKQILLDAPKEVYQKWGKSISYGVSEVDLKQIDALNIDKLIYDIPKKGNF